LAEIGSGPRRLRVGVRVEGRAPVRAGASLYAQEEGGEPIGSITSGGFGPTVDGPVAMGYVPSAMAPAGTRMFAELRGKRLAATIASLPFVPHRYKRG
jgi:aminomethyltransferase